MLKYLLLSISLNKRKTKPAPQFYEMCGFVATCVLPEARKPFENGDEVRAGDTRFQGHEPCSGALYDVLHRQLRASLETIKHRGPDGEDVWVNSDASVGLGHCRLAINDLSQRGSQPMHSKDGKVHAVVIGELYDYDMLRKECAASGFRFAGRSDSELVLALYQIYGAPEMFEHLRGEFSFVVVDERAEENRVVAARDRFGIKPLFWTVQGGRIVVAAEAKAFLALGWEPEWDVAAIASSGWLSDERTLFRGIQKLQPAHWMEVTGGEGICIRKYWSQRYPTKVCFNSSPRMRMRRGC